MTTFIVKHPAYNEYATDNRKAALAYVDTICDYLARREDVEIVEIDESGAPVLHEIKRADELVAGEKYRLREEQDWHTVIEAHSLSHRTDIHRDDRTWVTLFPHAKIEVLLKGQQ